MGADDELGRKASRGEVFFVLRLPRSSRDVKGMRLLRDDAVAVVAAA